MPHLHRLILKAAIALSLLLCVVSAGLWLRSCWSSDTYVRYDKGGQFIAVSNRGRMQLERLYGLRRDAEGFSSARVRPPGLGNLMLGGWRLFQTGHLDYAGHAAGERWVDFSYAVPVTTFATLPIIAAARLWLRRRRTSVRGFLVTQTSGQPPRADRPGAP